MSFWTKRKYSSYLGLAEKVILIILALIVLFQYKKIGNLINENATLKATYQVGTQDYNRVALITKNRELQEENLVLQEKLNTYASVTGSTIYFNSCDKNPTLRDLFPEELRDRISNKNVSGDIRTYEIYPRVWSKDCKQLAFELELVARGAGAYQKEDYLPRGLYIYNDDSRLITFAKMIGEDSFIDSSAYDSNYWDGPVYMFVELSNLKESVYTGKRYEFDTESNTLRPHIAR